MTIFIELSPEMRDEGETKAEKTRKSSAVARFGPKTSLSLSGGGRWGQQPLPAASFFPGDHIL
jgi:hypothetical protein